VEQPRPHEPARSEQTPPLAQPRRPRKRYAPPAIVSETRLETRAGSPLSNPIDPLNSKNDYGL
jgi:hypothetical protein